MLSLRVTVFTLLKVSHYSLIVNKYFSFIRNGLDAYMEINYRNNKLSNSKIYVFKVLNILVIFLVHLMVWPVTNVSVWALTIFPSQTGCACLHGSLVLLAVTQLMSISIAGLSPTASYYSFTILLIIPRFA